MCIRDRFIAVCGGLWGSKTGIAVAGAQKAVFACANEVAAIRFDELFCDEVVIFRVTVPVSYTHLDVYKRQILRYRLGKKNAGF